MQLLRSIKHIILFVGLIAGLSACGGGDDDITYNYTVTSATWFTGGEQVAVARSKVNGSCAAPTSFDPITRVGAGTVVTPGTVSFSFTTGVTPPIFESVYIDNNANGFLDSGDRVIGDDPNFFFGWCFDSLTTDDTFDWEVSAAQIQADLGLLQPSIIYTGPPQSFRSESGSEAELMIDKAIIVDGEGYHSTQW
jgi:hypothetical protein